MSQCRGCGREIIWLHMRSGKHMPVDPEPVFVAGDGKDTFITDEGETIRGTASEMDTGTVGFVPHWATCPAAEQFRKRG